MLVLLGAPGAGKGTQAPIVSDALHVPVLASGELLRSAVAGGTALGRSAEGYMKRGELVPDETIVSIFLDRLARPDAARGAILDGFPRTRTQAEALDSALASHGRRVDMALFIDVPVDELVRRMASRRICAASGHVYNLVFRPPLVAGICDIDGSELVQRADDREDTVRARMAVQIAPLEEVVDHYRAGGILRTVDCSRPIDEVSTEVLAVVATRDGAGTRRW